MNSTKMGSKLAESLKQLRRHPPAETTLSRGQAVTAAAPAAAAPASAPRAADDVPAASHGILHPRRIWPD